MKRLCLLLALIAVVGLVAGEIYAEGGDAPAKKPAKVRKPKTPQKPALRGAHAQMQKVCGLSEDQVKQINDLMAARDKALKEWNETNGDALKAANEKAKAAREAKDREAAKKVYEELNALRKGQSEITAKSQADVLAVLTDEQKAKWRTYNAVRSIRMRFRGIKLTDEQNAEIEKIVAAAGDKLNADDPKKRYDASAKIAEQVTKEVLTDEQRGQMALLMITANYRRAKLTAEQNAQIKAVYEKHMAGVDASDAKAKAAAHNKIHEEIHGSILTEDQKKVVRKLYRKPAEKKERPKKETAPKPKPANGDDA